MSYPTQRCPYCQREMPESDIDRAIEVERGIWRSLDCEVPEINLPSVWIETETVSTDSTTICNVDGTWYGDGY